jgi:AraC-like DNA-binding protein
MNSFPKLVSVSYYKALGNKPITPYTIPNGIEYLELLVAGKAYFCPDNIKRDVEFECGAMFWHMAGDQTIYKTDPESPYECLCLRFELELGRKKSPQEIPPRLSIWKNKEDAINFSNTIINVFHNNILDRESIGKYVYARVSWEAALFSVRMPSIAAPQSLEKLKNFVESHYSEDIVIRDMADIAGVSVPHLYSLTRQHLGASPHSILLDKRMREAKRLIVASDTPIKEISAACGFLNIETFYRAFKRKYMISPAALRKENEPRAILQQ